MNPHQMVPTLRCQSGADSELIWESNTIVRFLAARFGPELHGGTAEGMARGSIRRGRWIHFALSRGDIP